MMQAQAIAPPHPHSCLQAFQRINAVHQRSDESPAFAAQLDADAQVAEPRPRHCVPMDPYPQRRLIPSLAVLKIKPSAATWPAEKPVAHQPRRFEGSGPVRVGCQLDFKFPHPFE
jgi:hypothetical protein